MTKLSRDEARKTLCHEEMCKLDKDSSGLLYNLLWAGCKAWAVADDGMLKQNWQQYFNEELEITD